MLYIYVRSLQCRCLCNRCVCVSQLVLRLKTNTSEEFFLEACSREERDEWAAEIGSAVRRLGPRDAQTPSPAVRKSSQSLQLHDVNLR